VGQDDPGESEAELVWNEPVRVEAPCVQGATEDGDSVVQRSVGLGHAVSRISPEAAIRLGHAPQPNGWCQVRMCSDTWRLADAFLAKIASTLEIILPEGMMATRPREGDYRQPDVVIGTRDWSLLEGLLRNRWMDPNLEEALRMRSAYRWHIRIVLRDGERLYLNLLVSKTVRRSRIIAWAPARLGRESKEDGCMHLRDTNGTDVPISVDVVDTTAELVTGEVLPLGEGKPDIVLTLEDAQHLQGSMLTGWRKESDLLKGWASQGVKKDQIP
jgi:hypothetical protein